MGDEDGWRGSWWWVGWTVFRRVAVFLLGVALLVDGLSRGADPWPELLIGALMVGAFPLEDLPWPPRGGRREDRAAGD